MSRSFLSLLVLVASVSLAAGAPAHPKATPRATPKPKATPDAAASQNTPTATAATPAPGAENTGPSVIKVAICGDSTAAPFDPDGSYHGWGEFLQGHFTDAVQVINAAKKGRTARSFIDQGAWKDVLKQKPNVVLIQFGHNELIGALNSDADMTTALREYRKYLGAYIDTARKAGAKPIVLSPTHHMAFDPQGKPKDLLMPFVEAGQQLADSRGVPFIDIHLACERVFEALGAAKIKQFQGLPEDPVHFGKLGAWVVASIVAKELALEDKELASALKPAPSPLATAGGQAAQ